MKQETHSKRASYPEKRPQTAPQLKEEKALARIAGFSAVSALFARFPERVERLFYSDEMKSEVGAFCSILAKSRKPYRILPPDELSRVAGTAMHGGIVAVVKPQILEPLNVMQVETWAKDGKPILILDGVSNPHNFGAIARTAAFFGISRVILTDHPAQAGLSDASYRVAEGGLEYLQLYKAQNFIAALKKLRASYCVIAAAPGKHVALASLKKEEKPFALVLGNEEEGLSEATMHACDHVVSIPGAETVQSLNVSASASILLYTLTLGK